MYNGETIKLDSYDLKLPELIQQMSKPVVNEVVQPIKQELHEEDEFDDDKELQFAKSRLKQQFSIVR